jgi:hypothetical protein
MRKIDLKHYTTTTTSFDEMLYLFYAVCKETKYNALKGASVLLQ